MQFPSIALVARRPSATSSENWRYFESILELLAAPVVDIIILDLPDSELDVAVITLRNDSRYRFALISASDQRSVARPLLDGPMGIGTDELFAEHARLATRLEAFNHGRPAESVEERIMAWLWSRPDSTLAPLRDTSTTQMYTYPLVSNFSADSPVNETLWLRLMAEQGWLSAGELVDRIRLCSACDSSRINYIDVCPACKNMDIARRPALHCFTCGHVAPQENFLKGGLLLCPNCLARLRHIGSDYDRPLESLSCRACQSSFIDAYVQARCLDCNQQHSPDELRIREIHKYSLTETARLRCRNGFSEESRYEYFGRLNLISLTAFQRLLDWQIQQSRRYQDLPKCSVLALRLGNLDHLLSTPQGHVALDQLIERIKETIRDTDRCSRTSEDLLWFLLPHTDEQGVKVLGARLTNLSNRLDTTGHTTDVRMAAMSLPDDLVFEEDAQLLMARLAGGIE